jgi:hypothetical protein
MTRDQREIHRGKRILEYAERVADSSSDQGQSRLTRNRAMAETRRPVSLVGPPPRRTGLSPAAGGQRDSEVDALGGCRSKGPGSVKETGVAPRIGTYWRPQGRSWSVDFRLIRGSSSSCSSSDRASIWLMCVSTQRVVGTIRSLVSGPPF